MFNNHPSLPNHIVSFSKRILQKDSPRRTNSCFRSNHIIYSPPSTYSHDLESTTTEPPEPPSRRRQTAKHLVCRGRGERRKRNGQWFILCVRVRALLFIFHPQRPTDARSSTTVCARSARRRWREAEAADEADYFGHPSCLSDSDPLEIIRWSGCQRTLEHGNELFLVDPRPLDRSSRCGEGGPRFNTREKRRDTRSQCWPSSRIGRLTPTPIGFELWSC